MLLVVDVGNSNTVLGVYDAHELIAHWRVETNQHRTVDEHMVLLAQLFALCDLKWPVIEAGIIASVVPPALDPWLWLFRERVGSEPLVVGPGIKTGMPILYENPRDVGADRIVNAVAAYERYASGCIVVDFGTATTFDLVSPRGEYMGGAIAPGLLVSADALYQAAAKLPRVEIVRPERVVGRNTVASIQAGLVFGYVGMVDALVERMRNEIDFAAPCLATGGLASLIAKESTTIEDVDDMLTLKGLRLLYERNIGDAKKHERPARREHEGT